ncbi:alpha/beta fold hydrolase [Pseudoroseomonas globiformis]|uniref:Alpha/beta fold hydrolase n=1 Tax=Teichococcus globiformis TaxID=2307229 RepID=A0ABV7G0T7_9PROT
MQQDRRTTLFALHFLGGSARTWEAAAPHLDPSVTLAALDLPGFGDAAEHAPDAEFDVASMTTHVAGLIRARAPARWMLAGHSMGAKVAMALARRVEDGAPGLAGLAGIITLAGSPPSPEPMAEERRQRMLGWFAGPLERSLAEAEGFIDANTAHPLPDPWRALAVSDVMRANRAAWTAWLERGSREDGSRRIGLLNTPGLILAGGNDGDLGPEAQRSLMAPHFRTSKLAAIAGVAHLLPLEAPGEVAAMINRFARG